MRYVNILSALLFVFVIWVIPVKSDELNFPVTFDFVNMEISDILKAISVNYNINIVPDKDVSGRFSIRLSSVPLKTALNSFLNANGFKISEKDNIFSVSVIKENPYIKIIDNKLTLHSDNIPINEILRAVSVQTNLNIITSQPLDIKITAHINNVDPLSGLIKILNENGLSITQDNNYIKVYPVKPKYNIVYDDEKDYIAIEAVN
ncbi:MAG TPA: hypothetical protein PLQ81_14165, partial [bacterium]|nr:hypothetical protein [bacterium]